MRNILIADDHPLTLAGTKAFVEGLGYHVIETCPNGIIALNSISNAEPDIAILDISMPGLSGIDVTEKVTAKKLPTRIILLTMHNERSVYITAQNAGVHGYLLKEHATEELKDCLKAVSRGAHYVSRHLNTLQTFSNPDSVQEEINKLSVTEKRVIELIASNHTSKEIASFLFISERTVETHRRNIITKLDLPKEKNALLAWAMKNL